MLQEVWNDFGYAIPQAWHPGIADCLSKSEYKLNHMGYNELESFSLVKKSQRHRGFLLTQSPPFYEPSDPLPTKKSPLMFLPKTIFLFRNSFHISFLVFLPFRDGCDCLTCPTKSVNSYLVVST